MAGKSKVIDWERLDADWLAGIKTPEAMADEYNKGIDGTGKDTVTRQMIDSHYRRKGVSRDLNAKIQAKTKSIVAKSIVASIVAKSESATINDNKIIDAAAEHASTILIGHKNTISRARNLSNALLAELESQTLSGDEYAQMIELMKDSDYDKLAVMCQKIISTPSRVDSLKKLAETLKTLIGLERQALNIDDNANGDAPAQQPTQTSDFLNSLISQSREFT